MSDLNEEGLRTTPLTAHHQALQARMVPFAGYSMPVQYPAGIIKEHQAARSHAALFDVSHMGQAYLMGHEAAAGLERLVPGDITGLGIGRMRYTVLLNEQGGIIDDLMVLKLSPELLFIVVNASRKDVDYGVMRRGLPRDVTLEVLPERALVALQGPKSEDILAQYYPQVRQLGFMQGLRAEDGMIITRSGYSGEDGFEISQPTDEGLGVISQLSQHEGLSWSGLGARDSLRLEAGLCLYGHELDETISPVEADLAWVIGKRRRQEGNFPGAARILRELNEGPARKRVGLKGLDRAIAREQTPILCDGQQVGVVTSGGFGPSVNGAIAMGYVETALSAPGTELDLLVREQPHKAVVTPLPFIPHTYKK